MDNELALLDSSIWIRYLRSSGPADIRSAVERALAGRQIATCPAVDIELLLGSRNDQGFQELRGMLSGLESIPITQELWEEAASLGYRLRRSGVPLTVPDLLIAECAIASGRVLWHADRVFERVKQHSDLQTLNWPSA